MSSPEEPTERPSSAGPKVDPGRDAAESGSPADDPGRSACPAEAGHEARDAAEAAADGADRADEGADRAEGADGSDAGGRPDHDRGTAQSGEHDTRPGERAQPPVQPPDGSETRQGEGKEQEDPVPGVHLAPIPPDGTAAPRDRARVFGRPPTSAAPTPAPGESGWTRTAPAPGTAPALSEEQLTRLRKRGRLALTLGIGSALTLLLLPLGSVTSLLLPVGLVAGIIAVILGIGVVVKAKRASTKIPGAVPGIVLGTVSTVLIGIIAATLAVFWNEVNEYAECVSGANTLEAQDKCRTELERRLTERLEGMQRPAK